MSLYENLFLVNNIPKIEGILQVKDIIKQYAFMDIFYMIEDMKKAKKFAEKFRYVNLAIWQAYSRNKPIHDDIDCKVCSENKKKDIYQQSWTFGFDEEVYNTYPGYYQLCHITDYDEPNKYRQYFVEKLQMMSGNCYICGEYIPHFVSHWYNIPYCSCKHNEELYNENENDNDNI